MTALVIAEHDNASIKGATLNTVTAAKACGGDVHVLVAGDNAGAAAAAAAQIAGVSKVIHADGASLKDGLAENVAAQVLAIAGNYSHILFPATASGKNVAPAWPPSWTWARSATSPRSTAPTPSSAPSTPATPPPCSRPTPSRSSPCAAPALTQRLPPAARGRGNRRRGRQRQEQLRGPRSDQERPPELTAAKIIVSGGRALGSAEKFNEVMTPLADKLGAAIGAARGGGRGLRPNDLQVGQTGKIVAPQLYIACGISGAIQHWRA
jgi:electron transfer flavoprotein alpha subunit